jgi:hypothetical protein
MKLNIQLPLVASALVGARILRGTISAGYSQVIPSLKRLRQYYRRDGALYYVRLTSRQQRSC